MLKIDALIGRECISGKKIKEGKIDRILAIENHLPQKKIKTKHILHQSFS